MALEDATMIEHAIPGRSSIFHVTKEPRRPKKSKSPQQINRKKLKSLERRRDFLAARLDNYKGGSPSHDVAEKKALDWAIEICRQVTGLEEPDTSD